VEVNVVGVGLPGEHEAEGGGDLHLQAELPEATGDLLPPRGLLGHEGGAEGRGVLLKDGADPGLLVPAVSLPLSGDDHLEGRAEVAVLGEGHREQVVGGGVVRPLIEGDAVAVDRYRQSGRVEQAFEAVGGGAAEVGPGGVEVDQRAIRAGGLPSLPAPCVGLPEGQQRQHVAGRGGAPVLCEPQGAA
jgi:hypothetical protein